MKLFFEILGAGCILYCLSILFFTGYGTNFFLIWGFAGVLFLLWARYESRLRNIMPGWFKKTAGIVIVLGIAVFVMVEGMVLSGFFKKGKEGLDYIIVLGAQLKESGPSYVLQQRLDAAYNYLSENENTIVIVSGGQGSNEPDTEAQGMYDYLVGRGIAPERIIKEEQSQNTYENISFSGQFFDREETSVGIVTSNFHVFRALQLARAAGYKEVCGIAARSHAGVLPNNMLREFFGIMKDFLVGNLT